MPASASRSWWGILEVPSNDPLPASLGFLLLFATPLLGSLLALFFRLLAGPLTLALGLLVSWPFLHRGKAVSGWGGTDLPLSSKQQELYLRSIFLSSGSV